MSDYDDVTHEWLVYDKRIGRFRSWLCEVLDEREDGTAQIRIPNYNFISGTSVCIRVNASELRELGAPRRHLDPERLP